MNLSPQTLTKGERLKKKQHLDALFQSEHSFIEYPFRIVYCKIPKEEAEIPAKVLISIPKRRIKKAVNRNLLKRRTREAYRREKQKLYECVKGAEDTLALGFLYIANSVKSYDEITEAIIAIINKLKEKL